MNEQAQAIIDYIEARLQEVFQHFEDPTAPPEDVSDLNLKRREARDALFSAFYKPPPSE